MQRMPIARALPVFWLACLFAGTAQAQENCQPVNFAPGESTLELSGTAPPEDVVCFALTGMSGERVSVAVREGANIIFSIQGLIDAQDRYSIDAAQDSYRILVGQLMRSIDAAPFRIRVALESARRGSFSGARGQIAHAQTILNWLGYDAGAADGIAGPRTRRAIAAFQEDTGMAVTGEIDSSLYDGLLAAGAGEEVAARQSPGSTIDEPAEQETAAAPRAAADAQHGASPGWPSELSSADRPPDDVYAEPRIPSALGTRWTAYRTYPRS